MYDWLFFYITLYLSAFFFVSPLPDEPFLFPVRSCRMNPIIFPIRSYRMNFNVSQIIIIIIIIIIDQIVI